MAEPNQQPRLGRKYASDDRDWPLEEFVPARALDTRRTWWANGWWGDQGSTPQCVAYAMLHLLSDGPIRHKNSTHPLVEPSILYREAQDRDEWEGNDYDGTSARGACRAMLERGLIHSYLWAQSTDEIIKALLTLGPVGFGTWWHESMFDPELRTFDNGRTRPMLEPDGVRVGGHEILLNGVNLDAGVVRVKNSWGREWAFEGHAWMTFEVLDQLFVDDGDAVIVQEVSDGDYDE